VIRGFGRGERDVESGVSFVVLKLKPCERGGGEGSHILWNRRDCGSIFGSLQVLCGVVL